MIIIVGETQERNIYHENLTQIQASLRKQMQNPSSGLSTVYDSDYLVCQPVGPFHLQHTS